MCISEAKIMDLKKKNPTLFQLFKHSTSTICQIKPTESVSVLAALRHVEMEHNQIACQGKEQHGLDRNKIKITRDRNATVKSVT